MSVIEAELRRLIAEAVDPLVAEVRALRAALESKNNTKPQRALLTRAELAERLGCSASQVDRLRAEGMPERRVGAVPRFDLAVVLDWLRENDKAA